MGLTPLEGLVMGTRCGDINPAIPAQLQRLAGLAPDAVDRALNEPSGLIGLLWQPRHPRGAAARGQVESQFQIGGLPGVMSHETIQVR